MKGRFKGDVQDGGQALHESYRAMAVAMASGHSIWSSPYAAIRKDAL